MIMKKLLAAFASACVLAGAFTACNNKPAFVRLVAAVDSVNAYNAQQPEMTAPSSKISYDQVTNTVKFTYQLPDETTAQFYRDNISYTEDLLLQSLPFAPFSLGKEIVDAEASVMIVYDWKPDGHSEYLIESARIQDAWKAAQEAADQAESQALK